MAAELPARQASRAMPECSSGRAAGRLPRSTPELFCQCRSRHSPLRPGGTEIGASAWL